MIYLVTGGAGFIGSNFIYYMLEKYPAAHVICFDALTYAGNLETLAAARNNPEFIFIKGDITDFKAIETLFEAEKPDYCINFAAETHVDKSIENPSAFLRTNVIGTQILMDVCRKFGTKRFHQISTDEVYGDLPLDRPDMKFTEETPLAPSSPYSASKAAADLLVLAYRRTYKLDVTISRCSNNYGQYQYPEKLIPLMLKNAIEGKLLPVYGNGKNVRDWLYVKDHCAAIDVILHNGKSGEVYNIGGNNERSNVEVVNMILDALKKPQSLITYVEDRAGHDLRYAIDSSKIKTELGWQSETSFEYGIKSTIKWYRDNHKWLNNLAK